MASYNELNALIDAYINRNGVQAITGQILNGVLKAMVEQLGRGYTIMGAAIPTTDPGTPDAPECYFASTPGTYTDFDGLQIVPGELALLCYTPSDGWTKETIYEGFQAVQATIDGNVGTPSVGVSYADGVLSFDFRNMKGNPGNAAGFGTIGADITGGVGTPGVTVESSGPATAKNLQFHFTNLKGETGVTSVLATVDNTSGNPQCAVSLVGQQLTLAFSGLKGAQGDTGSSVDYPFTIVNNLTTDDAASALSAAQGVVLQGEITQLQEKVTDLYVRKIDYCDVEDYIPQTIALDTVGYYNYKLTPVSHDSNANFKCVKITGVVPGNMYKFDGYVAYSNLAAVVFMDSQDNCIGYLYGDNTSTEIHFDTGIISIPPGCASVAFNAYIGANHISTLTKYSLPKMLLEGDVNEIVLDIVNPDNDMVANLVPVDVGHFYNGNTLEYTANSAFSCAVADVNPTDKVSYSGKVRYGSLYAVIFADNNGTILQRIGHNPDAEETVNTGIIDVPVGATKVYFGALGNSFTAYIYKQPSLVNEFSFQEFYDNAQNKTRYCNPYHYVMGISQPDDLANSGFDANFESSTVGAFLVHDKYFRSYRRKHEWKVKLSATSVVRFGTGNNSNSIVVNDRMSHYVVDVPNSLLRIYRSSGSQETTVALGAIDPDAVYILRYEQYDYTMKVSVVDFATLDVVATFTNTATPSSSPLGKILGRPFIELQAGSLKVIGYDCYLMDKPKIVFIGDSITECGYRQDTYAAMIIRNKLKNDGCIIAQGGANNDVLTYARTAELPFMKPEYLSLLVGTNGTITTGNIQAWVSFCQEQGIKIIFNCVPVSLDPDNYPWATKNATIRLQGLLGAAFDYATALDNDPDDGGDPALFGDDVHPNADGQKAMYDRFLNDVHIFD